MSDNETVLKQNWTRFLVNHHRDLEMIIRDLSSGKLYSTLHRVLLSTAIPQHEPSSLKTEEKMACVKCTLSDTV